MITIKKNNEHNPYGYIIEYTCDTIQGFLEYSYIFDRIEIDNILVYENYRQNGIGTLLMEELINKAKELKVDNITLEVRKSNIIAQRLYKKFGFKSVAIRKYYYGDEDAILMERKVREMDTYILGVESSCDETSMSIVKNGQEELATVVLTQIDVHKEFNGVVPEIASRMHAENISIVLDELFSKTSLTIDDIDAIGVTYGPGLIGSLLVGVECAKTISLVTGRPLIPVHHIAGHIYANNLTKRLSFPLIALVVSGGHTELVLMREDYSFEKIGGTLDDAVGEAYDKVAKILGLGYPGGAIIDKNYYLGKDTYNLPYPLNDASYNFSFSGIKSAVLNMVNNEKRKGEEIRTFDMCTSFQERVVSVITRKTMKALEEYNVHNLVIAGGVSANSYLRSSLEEVCKKNNINFSAPFLKYCTDNATMIASAAYYAKMKNISADYTLNATSVDNLYKYNGNFGINLKNIHKI